MSEILSSQILSERPDLESKGNGVRRESKDLSKDRSRCRTSDTRSPRKALRTNLAQVGSRSRVTANPCTPLALSASRLAPGVPVFLCFGTTSCATAQPLDFAQPNPTEARERGRQTAAARTRYRQGPVLSLSKAQTRREAGTGICAPRKSTTPDALTAGDPQDDRHPPHPVAAKHPFPHQT